MKRVALIQEEAGALVLALPLQLAANGFDLAINGTRAAADVEDVLQKLKDFGNDVIYCQGNISSSTDRENIFAR